MNLLDEIMGTEEASKIWGTHQDHIKRLCREKKLKAVLIGKTWVLLKNQEYPRERDKTNQTVGI